MGVVGRYLGRRVAERKVKEFEQGYWNWAMQYFRIKVDGGMEPADALLEAHFTAYTRTWKQVEPTIARRGQAPHAYDSSAGMEAFGALAAWSQLDPNDVSAALNKHHRAGGVSWDSIRDRELMPNVSGAGPTVVSSERSEWRLQHVPECPKCGGDLLIVEHRSTLTEPGTELPWSRTFRSCFGGCRLTAEDFANG